MFSESWTTLSTLRMSAFIASVSEVSNYTELQPPSPRAR